MLDSLNTVDDIWRQDLNTGCRLFDILKSTERIGNDQETIRTRARLKGEVGFQVGDSELGERSEPQGRRLINLIVNIEQSERIMD